MPARSPRVFALGAAITVFAVTASSAAAPDVVVARATRVDFPITVEAVGTSRANESIEIRAKISETISAIRFTEGQRVRAGEILVELRDEEARASVAHAKAALVESNGKFERGKGLLASALLSASELETLQARRDADRAALDAAEARLAETVVRAPFAGRVGLRRVSVGSLVSPAVIITTLDDTDTMKLDFDVPETAFSLVTEGLTITARSAAWPDSVFEGHVATVDTRVDPVSRTVTVRALVPNDRGLLLPGMFLTVALRGEQRATILIPEQSIVPEQSRQFVLVVGEQGIVEKREIRIGRRRPGLVEVVAGLESGEIVVVEGTQKARPGEAVTIAGEVEVSL